MTLRYNGEDFTWFKSRQNPLNVGRYSFLFSEAIQNVELQYSFIPHSAHNKSHNTYTKSERQQAHGLTRRLGYLFRLVSKLPKKKFLLSDTNWPYSVGRPKKIFLVESFETILSHYCQQKCLNYYVGLKGSIESKRGKCDKRRYLLY